MNTSMDEKSSEALLVGNPAIAKLVEFAKSKRFITWDDVIEYLGQEFVNSDELMEPVLKQLKDINREPVETDIIGADDVTEDDMVDDEDDDGIMLQDDDDDISTDDETVKAMLQIRDLMLKSNKLKTSAKNNTVKNFELAYFDNVDEALIEGLSPNNDFFTLLLNNSNIKKELLGIFVDEIYKSLKNS